MTTRRAVLCVPASEPHRVAKAVESEADEVVVDLEDAVPADRKVEARDNLAFLTERAGGSLAVRINGDGTPWFDGDLAAAVENVHVSSIVVPKAESAAQICAIASQISEAQDATRPPLLLQALIETATGLLNAPAIAVASERVDSLILGYADLGASLGRRPSAPWGFAQDRLLMSARSAGIAAIDGPLLTVADDEALVRASSAVEALGLDGKWVIHPRQISTVRRIFTPSASEIEAARAILGTLEQASRDGRGAVAWRGQMLDEAVAVQARRVLDRAKR
jgi:citrate lyase beta subunit